LRRPRTIDILLTGLLGCGLALAAWGGVTGSPVHWAGAAMTALAGTWALASFLQLRRRCQCLAETLIEAGDAKLVEPDALARAGPEVLSESLGAALASARRAAVDAELHARELEIRLKIADAEREHAQAIIYSISDAVVVTDPFDDVVLANESAARTFKFDLDNSQRTPVRKLVHDAKVIELIRQMRQAGGRGGRRIVEHQVKHGDSTRTYKITLSTVADKPDPGSDKPAGNEVAGVVAVLHDVTHEREIAQLKNDFVSNVSHELRTPLASIKAYVELLIDGEAQDENTKREFYEVIQNEANRLGRLIDNILNISKIESGLIKIDRKPQSLAVIVKDAIEVIGPQAERKQITIKEQLTPVFYQAMADRDMLYQAVLNLLSNAVKYTPEGGEVTVETSVDEARRKVITRVSDNGVGIPPKDLPFIFDKFYRAEANSRMAQGTGLGLSLVKHIIETVHRGRIFVESQTGKGSCFGFELDLSE
jgi:two-component system, OmpR family, phosphate regulon sensor histidine kinase PhoR